MPPNLLAGHQRRGRITSVPGTLGYRAGSFAFRIEHDIDVWHASITQKHAIHEREALMPLKIKRFPVSEDRLYVCHVIAA
jgi:hypothetical protein